MTLNLNKLINTVGKDNYCEYINLFGILYKDYRDCDKSAYKYFLDSNVNKMEQNKCKILEKN